MSVRVVKKAARQGTIRMSGSPVVYSYGKPLLSAIFTERTNRFECKAKIGDSNEETSIYCPNTGSMLSLVPTKDNPTRRCILSATHGGTRKHVHTLEAVVENKAYVGIHSRLANDMVNSALQQSLVSELEGFTELNREVTSAAVGKDGTSRTDFELVWREEKEGSTDFSSFAYRASEAETKKSAKKATGKRRDISDEGVTCRMLVEVKSVTLASDSESQPYGERNAQFPDCVSTRASKHLRALMAHLEAGKRNTATGRRDRAAVLFLVQRDDISSFSPCHLDAAYTQQLSLALEAGVELICYSVKLDPVAGVVTWGRRIEFRPNPLPASYFEEQAEKKKGGGVASRKRKVAVEGDQQSRH